MSRDAIPDWVPSSIAVSLDVSELAPPHAEVRRERRVLEEILDVHMATYRVDATGKPQGLCVLYETAKLSPADLTRIRAAEQRYRHVIFVAYCRPLQPREVT